jgi:hypothetical protein
MNGQLIFQAKEVNAEKAGKTGIHRRQRRPQNKPRALRDPHSREISG